MWPAANSRNSLWLNEKKNYRVVIKSHLCGLFKRCGIKVRDWNWNSDRMAMVGLAKDSDDRAASPNIVSLLAEDGKVLGQRPTESL